MRRVAWLLLAATGVEPYQFSTRSCRNTLFHRSNRISLQAPVDVRNEKAVRAETDVRDEEAIDHTNEAAVRISPTPGKGLGVFAAAPIEPHTWICDYQGEIITDEESDKRYKNAATGSGKGDYIFRLTLKTETEPGLCVDAQDSEHFSRYFNHAEHGNLMPEVHEKQQRIEFRSTRSIEEGEELCFDYGMGYWRNRGWPSNDGRNYSQAEWDRKDAEDALYPGRRFPLPVGTRVPLVPLRPVELQAALTLPDAECRQSLLRCLEYFGATRLEPQAEEEEEGDDELLEMSYGIHPTAKRSTVCTSTVSVEDLAEAAAVCIGEAAIPADDESGSLNRSAAMITATAEAPQGDDKALLLWVNGAAAELSLMRKWRENTPRFATARHDAVALVAYLLYKTGYIPGSLARTSSKLAHGLPAARLQGLLNHLEVHKHERDERAVLDVLAVLEGHVTSREEVEELLDRLECWIRLGDGLVMG